MMKLFYCELSNLIQPDLHLLVCFLLLWFFPPGSTHPSVGWTIFIPADSVIF